MFPYNIGRTKSKIKCWQNWFFLDALRENLSPASLLVSGGFQESIVFLVLWLYLFNFYLYLSWNILFYVPFLLSLIRTLVTGFKPYWGPWDCLRPWITQKEHRYQLESRAWMAGIKKKEKKGVRNEMTYVGLNICLW